MKAGRKNLQRACQDGSAVALAEGESIMQVVTLRGSNLIEVTDGEGVKSLALFPAKFQKSFWIKNGNFVVVDASGRDEALESGSKIGCVVSRVLFHDQVRALEKSGEWPAMFKSTSNRWATGTTEGTSRRWAKATRQPLLSCLVLVLIKELMVVELLNASALHQVAQLRFSINSRRVVRWCVLSSVF